MGLISLRKRPTARTRLCTCPPTVRQPSCSSGHLIEEHPYLVEPLLLTPWDYEPVGPFRIQRYDADGQRVSATMVRHCGGDLFAAVDLFVSATMPPLPGYAAMLIDESYRVVLGYVATRAMIDAQGYAGWLGVGASFNCLAPLIGDPMTVAIWESNAREAAR